MRLKHAYIHIYIGSHFSRSFKAYHCLARLGIGPESFNHPASRFNAYQTPPPLAAWNSQYHLFSHSESFFRSEEHTSELQSLMRISYAVFCLKKKIHKNSHEHYAYLVE